MGNFPNTFGISTVDLLRLIYLRTKDKFSTSAFFFSFHFFFAPHTAPCRDAVLEFWGELFFCEGLHLFDLRYKMAKSCNLWEKLHKIIRNCRRQIQDDKFSLLKLPPIEELHTLLFFSASCCVSHHTRSEMVKMLTSKCYRLLRKRSEISRHSDTAANVMLPFERCPFAMISRLITDRQKEKYSRRTGKLKWVPANKQRRSHTRTRTKPKGNELK